MANNIYKPPTNLSIDDSIKKNICFVNEDQIDFKVLKIKRVNISGIDETANTCQIQT